MTFVFSTKPTLTKRDFSFVVTVILLGQGEEEPAIAAIWVTDGIDRCRVGFLARHHVRRAAVFDGQLVQVTDLLWKSECQAERHRSYRSFGCAKASIISTTTMGY
jgi:hypothetical protein